METAKRVAEFLHRIGQEMAAFGLQESVRVAPGDPVGLGVLMALGQASAQVLKVAMMLDQMVQGGTKNG